MKLFRSIGFLLCLVVSALAFSQTIDTTTGLQSTGNLLNLGGGLPWSGTVTGQAGGVSGGGSVAAYNPNTGNIIFSYFNATASQSIAINQALANAGTGILLAGYRYSWEIQNDLNNGGGNRGTLTGNVSLTGPVGNVLDSYNYNYSQTNTGGNFQTFSGSQLFSNPYQLSSVDKLTVSFSGHDQNWWAGYWGPRVHVDNLSLLYTVDPCKNNPAFMPTCSGFSDITTTSNLLNSSVWETAQRQAIGINTALTNAGIGAMVHGFNYGFNYTVGQSSSGCTAWNQDGSCSWTMTTPASVKVTASLTDSNDHSLFQKNFNFTGDNTTGVINEKFLLPTSLNQSMLGTASLSGTSMGVGS